MISVPSDFTFRGIKFVGIPDVSVMPSMSRSRKHSPMALRFLDALAETSKKIFPSFSVGNTLEDQNCGRKCQEMRKNAENMTEE